MAVYFQYKSSTVKDSIPIEGFFTTVGDLRRNILEKKILRRGRRSSDSDIILSDYDTKEDYVDDATVIHKYATVLIRRVPLQSSEPIILTPPPVPVAPMEPEVVKIDPTDLEWDEFVDDINGTETIASQSGNAAPTPTEVDDEDSRIKAMLEAQDLYWRNACGSFSRGLGQQTPPPGYVCHRCMIAGHFIKHCPTNGNPEFDFKRLRLAVALLGPDEAAFDIAMEGFGATNVLVDDDLIPNMTLTKSSEIIPQKQESVSVNESAPAATQESTPLHDVEVDKEVVSDEKAEKKAVSDESSEKKAEKIALPVVTPYENYMMSMGYNPYWGAYNGGYGYGYCNYGYGSYCYGPYGYGQMHKPFVEQNMKNSGTGFNAGPPQVRNVNQKRKQDDEKCRSSAVSSSDHLQLERSDRRSANPEHIRHRDHPRSSSRGHHHPGSTKITSYAKTEKEEAAALKKRKLSSSSNGYTESRTTSECSRKRVANDDDRHFKRRHHGRDEGRGGKGNSE